jgi:phosphoglucomutase
MTIKTMATQPFPAQIPGTSGLRKDVAEFSLPGYFENVVPFSIHLKAVR